MAHCLSTTTTITHCLIMFVSEYIVISYHSRSLTFQQSLIVMAQPLTPLAVGRQIWLQDVEKCLEDMAGIITGVSKLEKGWIIYQLCLPSISTTIAVPISWSSPPLLSLFMYNIFLQCSEGQSAVSIWHHSTSPSPQISTDIKFKT